MPMDPVTTIGLASAIVTLVEIASKIAERVKELSDVPGVFRDIRTRLPLVIRIVVSAHKGTDNPFPEVEEALEKVVRQCFDKVNQLDEILKKVTITHG